MLNGVTWKKLSSRNAQLVGSSEVGEGRSVGEKGGVKQCANCELSAVCLSGAMAVELWRCAMCGVYRVIADVGVGERRVIGYHRSPACVAWLPVEEIEACRKCLNFGVKNKYQITEMP